MDAIRVNNQTLYRFVSHSVKTNMYVLLSAGKALIVDPHTSKEAFDFLESKQIKAVTIFLTHEHPDHTCGVPTLVKTYKSTLICQKFCAEAIAVQKNNLPRMMAFVLSQQDKINGTNTAVNFINEVGKYKCKADLTFENQLEFDWEENTFKFIATKGHSKGSCCIMWNDKAVFTGDSMIRNTPVITRFSGGSQADFEIFARPFLNSLPQETLILAGHGDIFYKSEQRN